MGSRLSLFENVERSDPRPQRAAETTYQFIQRVDDPAFARVRSLFNEWLDHFASLQGDAAASDLLGRFRSKQDSQFYAAFWELYLHEVHARLGFEITVHTRRRSEELDRISYCRAEVKHSISRR